MVDAVDGANGLSTGAVLPVGVLVIIYLDEFHRLTRRRMDEKLLKAMDSYPGIWLASSAMSRELDVMIKNRFDEKIEIELPMEHELAELLAHRCKDLGVWCPDGPRQTFANNWISPSAPSSSLPHAGASPHDGNG